MFKKIAFAILCIASTTIANAYEIREAFLSSHFAVNEVILGKSEAFNDDLLRDIKRDVLTRNRTSKKYQSTTAIFPANSKGLKGNTGEKVLGILDIRTYPGQVQQINFYDKLDKAAYAGIIITYEFLQQMVDQKLLNPLLSELGELPIVYLDVPVELITKSINNDYFVTNRSNQVIMDIKILGSDFYANYRKDIKEGCKIAFLAFGARRLEGIPLFLGLQGALNNVTCNGTSSPKPTSSEQQ